MGKRVADVEEVPADDFMIKFMNSVHQYLDTLLNSRAAALLLGVSIPTIRRMRRDGRLKAVPLGCGCVRFSPSEVKRMAEVRDKSNSGS